MRRLFGVATAALLVTTTGLAMFGMMGEEPVDRLIKNTTAFITEHPDDAMGPYTLARIHYLAFAKRTASIGTIGLGSGELPLLEERFGNRASFVEQEFSGRPRGASPPDAQLSEHFKAAVENYQKAIKMDAKNALFHLGLASVMDAAFTARLNVPEPSEEQRREQAIAEYLRAYELSVKRDSAITSRPITGLNSLVSYESGKRYVEMVNERGARGQESETLKSVQATIKTMDGLRSGAITPILFSLDTSARLEDLLDSRRTVTFDLDGTRRPQRYTWVRPDTGILVWDPSDTGQIRSGHQLFGSVSFNMFWSDGYRALDALDDNRDGVLTGNELIGLAVWFDRNQDGVSQPGEVIPISRAGIAALSARWTERVGDSFANPGGLITDDGSVRPTYDWVTESISEKTAAPRETPVS